VDEFGELTDTKTDAGFRVLELDPDFCLIGNCLTKQAPTRKSLARKGKR